MFASMRTGTVTLPPDDGQPAVTVTIMKLSWRQLREASDAQTASAVKTANETGPELLKALRDVAAPARPSDPREARYRQYDQGTVLRKGVKSWTSGVPLQAGLDDLDDETADRLHREVLDLSLAPLDPEAALGEGSRASTGS